MPAPPRTPENFREILELVWWRLDAALDLEMIRASARLGALEALECGTTAIIDHHESPNAIEGSLTVIADACAEVGVRVVAAYGVTDRHGPAGAVAGLAENERFLRGGGRGLVGIHAAFTCTDETIEAAAGLACDLGVGVHVHVAEGDDDRTAAKRLGQHTTDDWLLVHCVHLSRVRRSARDDRAQSAQQHEQRGRATRARHGSRTESCSVPTGSAPTCSTSSGSRTSRLREDDVERDTRDRVGLARERLRARSRGAHRHGDVVVRARGSLAARVHDRRARGRRRRRRRNGVRDGQPTRVDADEIRAHATEQARRLFARL